MDEVNKLANEIKFHNQKYWVENKPVIADEDYDILVERLRVLAPTHPILTELVEEQKGKKVKHDIPMLSLEKLFSAEDISKWATAAEAFFGKNRGLVASYKVDGSSCSILYEKGQLIQASTRGNGKVGDDITANVKVIEGIPHLISTNKKIEIRGEIYMSKASFSAAINKFESDLKAGKAKEEDRPVNARNYAAGSIKQKDPSMTKARGLSFMAHGLVFHDDVNAGEEANVLQVLLPKIGFETPFVTMAANANDIQGIISSIEKERKELPYDIDGVVFAVNNISLHKELGETSHHPKYKVAFKFARERGETEIVDVIWATSRNGRVVPKIELKPIFLGEATVTFCTGHHAKNIKDNELAPGDVVLMEREVIPYLVKKLKCGDKKFSLPKKCPSCGSELEWDETETHLLCLNIGGCNAQIYDYICHYVSRKVTNMVGVGEEVLLKLLEKGLIKTPADLFKLSEKIILDNLERQGETSAKKIVAAIQDRKEQPLSTFLQSLGIRHLGSTVSERLSKHFGSLDKVLSAQEEEMLQVEKVAEKMAKSLVNGLKSRRQLIETLLVHVKIIADKQADGPLLGKSFCLTGHVEFDYEGKHYDSRPDIEDLIKSKGGTIKSVSKGLCFLVSGEASGSKVEKAKKTGIPIVDAKSLVKLLIGA